MKSLLKNLTEPTYVWYADKPPFLGGVPRQISIEELEEKVGGNFRFSENIFAQDDFQFGEQSIAFNDALKWEATAQAQSPLADNLVICFIDDKVGYGLFARETIKLGDVICIYSGELRHRQRNDENSVYGLNVGDTQDRSDLCVDAARRGGIARFAQHLPTNPQIQANRLIKELKKNPQEITNLVQFIAKTSPEPIPPFQLPMFVQQFNMDILHGNGQMLTQMISYNRSPQELWELNSLDLDSIEPTKIAWCNLAFQAVQINGVPVQCAVADRTIAKGEQLGFSYGQGYWVNKREFPALFSTKGNVIPRDTYRLKSDPQNASSQSASSQNASS